MVANSLYYDLLDIQPDATQDDIKKAYKKMILKEHPDKGGDSDKFKQINEAYQVLSDPNKKELYDRYGVDYDKPGVGMQHGMHDMPDVNSVFGNFFGGSGIFMEQMGPFGMFTRMNVTKKTANTNYNYNISLEKLCTKDRIKLRVVRKRVCECVASSPMCKQCNGKGVTLNEYMGNCQTCQSIGKIIHGCIHCEKGVVIAPKIFEMSINPRLQSGFIYTFTGEGDQEIGKEPGDFIITLIYEKHPVWSIKNNNLYIERRISIKQALLGYTESIKHPSGDMIHINTKNKVLNPYEDLILTGKGLHTSSHIQIHFHIDFPKTIANDTRSLVENLDI